VVWSVERGDMILGHPTVRLESIAAKAKVDYKIDVEEFAEKWRFLPTRSNLEVFHES
jgi:hypothetical protein